MLYKTLADLEASVRHLADAGGTSALARHPQARVYDCINRGLGALYRILSEVVPDARYLSSTTFSTVAGTSLYALPATFDHLISIDLGASSARTWLMPYNPNERPLLTDAAGAWDGVPGWYRLRGSYVELLPTPGGVYSVTIWFCPSMTELSSSGDQIDTISRLDEYVIAYAARLLAIRDKDQQLVSSCNMLMQEVERDLRFAARSRDKNGPPRPVDVTESDGWGTRWR